MDSNDLYGISLILSLLFFVILCIRRVLIFIPPLDDFRERLVAALLALLILGGALATLAGIIDSAALRVIARIWMLVTVWTLNSFIIHYWTLVAKGEVQDD